VRQSLANESETLQRDEGLDDITTYSSQDLKKPISYTDDVHEQDDTPFALDWIFVVVRYTNPKEVVWKVFFESAKL
jgi:hypothetical protein